MGLGAERSNQEPGPLLWSGQVVEEYLGKGYDGKGGNIEIEEKGKALPGGVNSTHRSGIGRVGGGGGGRSRYLQYKKKGKSLYSLQLLTTTPDQQYPHSWPPCHPQLN